MITITFGWVVKATAGRCRLLTVRNIQLIVRLHRRRLWLFTMLIWRRRAMLAVGGACSISRQVISIDTKTSITITAGWFIIARRRWRIIGIWRRRRFYNTHKTWRLIIIMVAAMMVVVVVSAVVFIIQVFRGNIGHSLKVIQRQWARRCFLVAVVSVSLPITSSTVNIIPIGCTLNCIRVIIRIQRVQTVGNWSWIFHL